MGIEIPVYRTEQQNNFYQHRLEIAGAVFMSCEVTEE